MRVKGYSGYHGRKKKQKWLLALVLIVLVLLCAGFLLAQEYIIYDDSGKMHLDLPFFHRDTQEDTPPLNGEEVNIDIVSPEVSSLLYPVKELHGRMMAGRVLTRDAEKSVAAVMEEDVVIEVKRVNGSLTYRSQINVPAEVENGPEGTLEQFQAVLAGEKYVVARMATLCDSYFVRAYRDAALSRDNGGYWYDGDSRTWLDPAHPQTLVYITSLCQELASLGVDELMLDYFSYPTTGNLSAIYGLEEVDRAEVLADFAAALRANLPEGMVLGIVLRQDLTADNGVSAEMIRQSFDRVYLAADVDASQVQEALGGNYGAERYVTITGKAPETGGYLLG